MILTLRPSGSETYNQFNQASSKSANNYLVVDEETLSESDYLYTYNIAAAGLALLDIFTLPDHSTESGTINSITVKCQCKKVGTGGTDTVNPALKIGGTVYNSGAQTLTTSTALYSYTWNTNPNTSSAWGSDWAVIDALLAGYSLQAWHFDNKTYDNAYCYQFWVEVYYTEAASGHPTSKRFGGVPFATLRNGIWCL